MNATEIMYLQAKADDKKLVNKWGSSWSGFTAEEVRKFENECESKFNTDAEVNACVAEKKKSGKTTGINWGNIFTTGLNTIQSIKENQGTGGNGYRADYAPDPPKKSNTALWVIVGVVGVAGVVGLVWYMNKNKGK
jgi:hypothetical protein